MVEFIEGIIDYIGLNFIIVNTGNFGFKVEAPLSTVEKVGNLGDKVRLYTYLQIKEKDISLFGFLKREERDLFLLITGVSGVGPKTGLAILSLFSPDKLEAIIMDEDIDALKRVPGIGKKTAQRMILELKGTIERGFGDKKEKNIVEMEDVYLGLEALGYSKSEIRAVVNRIGDRIPKNGNINEIIRIVLREMDKNG